MAASSLLLQCRANRLFWTVCQQSSAPPGSCIRRQGNAAYEHNVMHARSSLLDMHTGTQKEPGHIEEGLAGHAWQLRFA